MYNQEYQQPPPGGYQAPGGGYQQPLPGGYQSPPGGYAQQAAGGYGYAPPPNCPYGKC